MKKQNDQNKSLREKLGQHEFQIPDTSWQNMEAILDGRKPVPQPAKPPLRWWAPGGKWGLSTLFIFGITAGVMAVSIFTWQQLDMNTPEMPLSSFTIPLDEEEATDERAVEMEAAMLSQNRSPEQEMNTDNQADDLLTGMQNQAGLDNRQAANRQLIIDNTDLNERSSREEDKATAYNENAQAVDGEAYADSTYDLPLEQSSPVDSKSVDKTTDEQKNPVSIDIENSETLATKVEKKLPVEEERSAAIDALERVAIHEPNPLTIPKVSELEQEIDPLTLQNRFDMGIKWGGDFRTGMNSHVFGLHFTYQIDKDWSVEIGMQYKERSFVGQNNLVATITDTVYWPNMVETYYRIDSIRHLHFFEVPLVAHYHLRPTLSLFAGGQLTFTDNNAWDETNYKQDEYGNGGIGSFSSGGYHSPGIVKVSAGMILGGHYRFSKNFGVDLRYVQGITDLTYDEYYGNTDNYLNTSLQLTLKWYWL